MQRSLVGSEMCIRDRNVSLYNETDGVAIYPCPVIGMVGTISDVKNAVGTALAHSGKSLYVLGQSDAKDGWLGASLLAAELGYGDDYAPPPVNLNAEKHHGEFVAKAINDKAILAAHDIADGGLLVAVTEMALKGRLGVNLTLPEKLAILFGEDQARYVVVANDDSTLETMAKASNVPILKIGAVTQSGENGFGALKIGDSAPISLAELFELNEAFLPQIASA